MTLDHVNRHALNRVNMMARNVHFQGLRPSRLDTARQSLRAAMREARSQGFTQQEIADAAGISRQRVHQLLQEEK